MSEPNKPPAEPNPYDAPQASPLNRRKADERRGRRRLIVWAVSVLLIVPAAFIAGCCTCVTIAISRDTLTSFVLGWVMGIAVLLAASIFPIVWLSKWAKKS